MNTIVGRIGRFDDQILVTTAAYTGMRWGELTGLSRANTHLGDGLFRIAPEVGALHELGGKPATFVAHDDPGSDDLVLPFCSQCTEQQRNSPLPVLR